LTSIHKSTKATSVYAANSKSKTKKLPSTPKLLEYLITAKVLILIYCKRNFRSHNA